MDKEELEKRKQQLKQLQSESLGLKIQNTMAKVMEFYRNSNGLCWLVGDDLNTCVLADIIDRFLEPLVNYKIGYDIKKSPLYRNIIVATIVEGNKKLEKQWYEIGCNSFEEKISRPMSFWTKKDIEEYSNKYLKFVKKEN